MYLTYSNNACYQFNLGFDVNNIQGYILEQDETFIKIKIKRINVLRHNIKTIDDIICLSKNTIMSYFKISEN